MLRLQERDLDRYLIPAEVSQCHLLNTAPASKWDATTSLYSPAPLEFKQPVQYKASLKISSEASTMSGPSYKGDTQHMIRYGNSLLGTESHVNVGIQASGSMESPFAGWIQSPPSASITREQGDDFDFGSIAPNSFQEFSPWASFLLLTRSRSSLPMLHTGRSVACSQAYIRPTALEAGLSVPNGVGMPEKGADKADSATVRTRFVLPFPCCKVFPAPCMLTLTI